MNSAKNFQSQVVAGTASFVLMSFASIVMAEDVTTVDGSVPPISIEASQLGQPVPDSVIVESNGLEWVWASPCTLNGCTTGIDVGHDGFEFATDAQWELRPPVEAFLDPLKCASPWFDHRWNNCDVGDALDGYYGSSPDWTVGPNGGQRDPKAETWLVRLAYITVNIDIKPGGVPNSINLCSNGTTPVAVLGSTEFDVYDIDTETLRFADSAVKMIGKKDPSTQCSYNDENLDGFVDLICHFYTTDIASLDGESTSAMLKGELLDGTPIQGTDTVNIVKDTCD